MYSINYLVEKFTQAVYDLSTGQGDARSRIAVAYGRFRHIDLEEFPQELRKDREEITYLLTRLGGREGYILVDNLSRMKNKTASRVARLILEIYFQLVEIQNRESTRIC
ncbi:MAG: hypothetical protein WBD99_02340 [Thermodesulfobacteriota bacterium]